MTLSDTTNRNNAINSLCYAIPLWIALAAFQVFYLHRYDFDDWNKTINERIHPPVGAPLESSLYMPFMGSYHAFMHIQFASRIGDGIQYG